MPGCLEEVVDPQVLGAPALTAAELEEKLRRALGLLARDDLDRLCPEPRDGHGGRKRVVVVDNEARREER